MSDVDKADLLERIEGCINNAEHDDEQEALIDARDCIEAQDAEIERLREHLISALDTLKDAEVCDDNCGPCNEAWAALKEKSK